MAFFVKEIAGDRVSVNIMIPDQYNPTTYEPTVEQLVKLENSQMIVSNLN